MITIHVLDQSIHDFVWFNLIPNQTVINRSSLVLFSDFDAANRKLLGGSLASWCSRKESVVVFSSCM
jgi:hypothetical protein